MNLRAVWARWWVLPNWPASCWHRAIGSWTGNRDRQRAIPYRGTRVSTGGSWTADAGHLRRSSPQQRRWPNLHVLGPWPSFHSSSTLFCFENERRKRTFNNDFVLLSRVVVFFLQESSSQRVAINNLTQRIFCCCFCPNNRVRLILWRRRWALGLILKSWFLSKQIKNIIIFLARYEEMNGSHVHTSKVVVFIRPRYLYALNINVATKRKTGFL